MASYASDSERLGPPVHPGRIVSDELEERGWSPEDFAGYTNCSPSTIRGVLRGQAPVSDKLAKNFGQILGISAGLLCRMQRRYDRTIAYLGQDPAIQQDLAIFPQTPWEKLLKVGWTEDLGTDIERVLDLRIHYGVKRLTDVPRQGLGAAFRITTGSKVDPWALAAWLKQGEWQSIERNFLQPDDVATTFNRDRLIACIPQLRRLTNQH